MPNTAANYNKKEVSINYTETEEGRNRKFTVQVTDPIFEREFPRPFDLVYMPNPVGSGYVWDYTSTDIKDVGFINQVMVALEEVAIFKTRQ